MKKIFKSKTLSKVMCMITKSVQVKSVPDSIATTALVFLNKKSNVVKDRVKMNVSTV
jgi:hypothetical protein